MPSVLKFIFHLTLRMAIVFLVIAIIVFLLWGVLYLILY